MGRILCFLILAWFSVAGMSSEVAGIQKPAALLVVNRHVTDFRLTLTGLTPELRAVRAADTVAKLSVHSSMRPVEMRTFVVGGERGVSFVVDGHPLFSLMQGDLNPEEGGTLENEAAKVAQRLSQALLVRSKLYDVEVWVEGGVKAGLASLMMVVLLLGFGRLRKWLDAAMGRALEHPRWNWRWKGLDVEELLGRGMHRIATLVLVIMLLIAAYLWLTFSLSQFPYTYPWSQQLGGYFVNTGLAILGAILSAVPDLVTVVLIFFSARVVNRMVTNTVLSLRHGGGNAFGLHPETIPATRRLVTALVWVIATIAAYPYFPGSDTEAFKGISVFIGVMLSLGSSGVVAQAMSGMVVVYSRAVRRGDMVVIGNTEGRVTELGALAVKIRTVVGDEVTVPNSVVIGNPIRNYSRLESGEGASLVVTVTIGYDTPWRQVHSLLELAARMTEGVKSQPEPRVLQVALSDFYVEYRLIAQIDDAHLRPYVLSALHAQVQDVFSEFGVQIMSPNFVAQPQEPVVVSPEGWYVAPASPPARGSIPE